MLAELGDPEGASNIGALLPFFMMVLMAKGFIIATPFIVRSVSGNIMMPALSAGFGGSYAFARGLAGSQQVYNRYAIGGATGAEYAALRARQFLGVQALRWTLSIRAPWLIPNGKMQVSRRPGAQMETFHLTALAHP